ncbi:MAG: PKD domain-containing protein, partial [Candidatus Bathyarchaeota archaeon]|nr:PKD domain-containing protein [Candidatus Bathyarchaeota archaeon]
DGTIASWAWTFGDTGTSTSQSPSHTYAAAGTYTVRLTVTDDDGATNYVEHSVTVSAPTPITIILRPNAAGSTTENEARGSGSANWDRVDEVTADDGTTYVRGDVDNTRQTDTYNVPDQSLTGTITNVRIYIRSLENYDRNDVYAWTAIRIGTGSIQYGTQIGTTTSWTNYYTDYATKTGNLGSGAWTWADINNLQIGVGLQSHNSSGTWRYAECTQVWVVVEYIP